jgi:hypothetical protein
MRWGQHCDCIPRRSKGSDAAAKATQLLRFTFGPVPSNFTAQHSCVVEDKKFLMCRCGHHGGSPEQQLSEIQSADTKGNSKLQMFPYEPASSQLLWEVWSRSFIIHHFNASSVASAPKDLIRLHPKDLIKLHPETFALEIITQRHVSLASRHDSHGEPIVISFSGCDANITTLISQWPASPVNKSKAKIAETKIASEAFIPVGQFHAITSAVNSNMTRRIMVMARIVIVIWQ